LKIMDGLLEGKIAVITGAGSGVGRAASLIFAKHGAKVVAADVNVAAVEETVAQVKAAGGEAIARTCDVSKADQVTALVAAAVEQFGRLDIMYNNAGITNPPRAGDIGMRKLTMVEQDEIDLLYGVNVNGVIYGCQAATRQFQAQAKDGDTTGGVIVNTASVVGLVGYGSVLYSSTKGAITTLTRSLAMELAGEGIRVNSVCPSGMPTNFMPGVAQSAAALASMGATHPLGRAILPEECANGALFLASDLSANITGHNLPVDGGFAAGQTMRRR
jgi:NAD(P)-dependent dehydrogenase (short-subunit alcohol dehydrogenase family)